MKRKLLIKTITLADLLIISVPYNTSLRGGKLFYKLFFYPVNFFVRYLIQPTVFYINKVNEP